MRRPVLLLHLTGNGRPPSLLGRALAAIAAVALFVLAFTVSVFVLAGALAVGALAWGWMLWKTRGLRRQLRAQMDAVRGAAPSSGVVIEGEVVRRESRDG